MPDNNKPSMTIYVERNEEDANVRVEYDCSPEDALLCLLGATHRVAEGMGRDPLEILALVSHELVRQKALSET